MPTMPFRVPATTIFLSMLLAAPAASASPDDELSQMSLEQLGDVVITSVSRQEERLSNAAAAIYIISSSEIARSGVRTLPEALRLAPNLQVAHVDARNYAVTARGYNSVFENKLLVLIDGRSIYSPLTSGVYWDVQDVVMADIERIEVISGPGATIYGANAVNGVINIITKSSKDTHGGLVSAAGGGNDRSATLRFGGALPHNGHYRAYATGYSVDDTYTASGVNTEMGMRRSQAGFRTDWDLSGAGLTVSGDAYQGKLGQRATVDIKVSGANLTTNYTTRLANGSDLSAVLILDHTERNQPTAFVERLDTVDLQAQHNVRLGQDHRLSWGAGYRYSMDHNQAGPAFAFLPGDLNMHWGNLFVQDEMTLAATLKVTAGIKAEHNNYTGMEYLPNLRLAWTPGTARLIWASLARSVRAPSRVDRDFYAPIHPPVVNGVPKYFFGGGPNFVSEVVDVLEIGYRAQPTNRFSYSVTSYYGRYDKLSTLEFGTASTLEYKNFGKGTSAGIEAWGRWQVRDHWRLTGGLAIQHIITSLLPGSRGVAGFAGLANADPKRRYLLRSSHDLSDAHQLDFTLRYNSSLKAPEVPAYHELDVQWLWKLRPTLDVALIGQNLLHSSHAEYGLAANRSVVERSALLKLVKRF
ncbi:MAG: TonB-dependent receptor plug domain-containing protein [Pseudomonadota bacterium]